MNLPPGTVIFPLMALNMAEAEEWLGAEPSTDESPERVFERRFALSVLDVAAAVLRLRKAYRKFVREEVAAGLVNPAGVDEEIRHLAGALAS